MTGALVLLVLLSFEPPSGLPQDRQEPPGPHFGASDAWRPFEKDRRLVAAYYYAWYDAATGAHMTDRDGSDALQDHPASFKDFSGRSAAWHRRELGEMAKAGVDIVLPFFQGDAVPVKAMAEALDALDSAPRVGAFVDPASFKEPDLFRAIRDFYSLIPPRHWALVDGRPLVWLAPVERPFALGPVFEGFVAALGRTPFVVGELSWPDARADAWYAWGAAREGPRELDVVSVGPGYNDTAVPGRRTAVREREEGRFYERSWYVALRIQPRFVAVETWNDFHEATEVCESREHGRRYLETTARGAEKLRKGEGISAPKGPWTGAPNVAWSLFYEPNARGLRPVPAEDGLVEKVRLAGNDVLTTKANRLGTARRVYFDVDDSWLFWEKKTVEVLVDYFDQGEGAFEIEYDSADAGLAPRARAVKAGGRQALTGTGEWRTARFVLAGALFANRQAGGADFRLSVDGRGLMLRRVIVRMK